MIVESKNSKALRRKKRIAARISFDARIVKMLTAIDLNNETGGVADEVRNVRSNWCLPPKACIVQTVRTQRIPDDLLGIRRITP